ncbi:hypothetical protein PM03_01815 [Thalassobacter stenotrophicus]|uniref:alpha-E domain-containing protein n=1 Tax=Thalassobacter TaxID=266808 RepID=UPI00051D8BBB|nr:MULTISPECIES: alpha-E domain-containing protein [Thalassobacter]KGK80690.1 hypothetical protein PM03_01815 [Thalassobacter stenotrophicus]KGL02073.1 hypothetical protein PM04_05840 [Thalassobacter sp. 16PALIMAR09]
MLGKTAGGLYWMFRNLERAENTARLIEAGFRIALTRSTDPASDWRSVIVTSAQQAAYEAKCQTYQSTQVTEFLLRDPSNPSSVMSLIKNARDNARLTRTAITSEVWGAVNETWMRLCDQLSAPVPDTELPKVLASIRRQSALVRGALHGTMLRNDVYDFCRLGTFLERADNTARIVDVKYHALLPSPSFVGSKMDNVQWETLLRSVSGHRAFRWGSDGEYNAANIANFLILDRRMPRSLGYCADNLVDNLTYICDQYGQETESLERAHAIDSRLRGRDIHEIFDEGMHEFLSTTLIHLGELGLQIEKDYRFFQ